MPKITTREQAVQKIRDTFGDKYDLSRFEYNGAHKKSVVICSAHGEFKKTPTLLYSGYGCNKCTVRHKLVDEVISSFRVAHGDRYDYSKVSYSHTQQAVEIICSVHGPFFQSPASHQKGHGCPPCAPNRNLTNEWLKKFRSKYGDRFSYDKNDRITTDGVLVIGCQVHGDVTTTAALHLRSQHGCPRCFRDHKNRLRDSKAERTPRPKVDWLLRFKEAHGDRYDYSEFSFVGQHKKSTIICKIHGAYVQSPVSHSKGYGCHQCSSKAVTFEECIRRFRAQHGDRFDYSKVDFVSVATAVTVICPNHGEFSVQPVNHWKTQQGCKKCVTDERRKKTGLGVVERFKGVHGDRYNYDNFLYTEMHTVGVITCRVHGDFVMTPANHLSDHGCASCWQNTASKPETAWGAAIASTTGWPLDQSRKIKGVRSVVDFVCESTTYGKVVIEYDGQYWHGMEGSLDNDTRKTEKLIKAGYQVVRLRVEDGKGHLPALPAVPGAVNIYVPEMPDEESTELAVKEIIFALSNISSDFLSL